MPAHQTRISPPTSTGNLHACKEHPALTIMFARLFLAADDRRGVLTVDGVQHEVLLQDLPTVVESYKTLDDANLVKVTDIGQVGPPCALVVPAALGLTTCATDSSNIAHGQGPTRANSWQHVR